MSDNLLSKANNSKGRRGARAIKKNSDPTVNDVSQILSSMLNLSIKPQTRPPRRPKVSKNHHEFLCKNSEIHQMVTDSNVFEISPKRLNKLKRKENICEIQVQETVSVQNREIVSVQTQEIITVKNQEIVSVESKKKVSIQTEEIESGNSAEVVSNETNSEQITHNEDSPEEKKISSRQKKRQRWRKKKGSENLIEESTSVEVQGTENVSGEVVTVKTLATKTFSKSKAEGKSKSEKKSKDDGKSSGKKSRAENETEDPSSSEQEKNKKSERDKFPPSIPVQEARELLEKQPKDNPTYIEGNIRINMKFSKHAYLSMSGGAMDILIIGARDRNRALEGDLVVVCINPEEKWFKHPSEEVQRTGVVVSILEKVHPRKTVGFIKQQQNGVLFYPRDSRTPLLRILNPQLLPPAFSHNPDSFKEILFLADIVFWKKPFYAFGKLIQSVGCTGDLRVETNAILLENDLDIKPFDDSLLRGLPPIGYIPTAMDLEGREDWRSSCIFTIDPATAVDLDDAVCCKPLDNGNYEVSVHISDVTHYLEAFTPLDKRVADRATTVYLVDNVYHMLPKQLYQVSSLLPGEDKLAFSVIWEMTPTAEVISHRFAKTVINSCCQMAYGQAQAMIENPTHDWSTDPTLNIKGHFVGSQLSTMVNNLFKLSSQMRERRFATGALRIDQPKLYISLDRETGIPISCSIEEQKESNKLIEEFMLLANMTVARQLYDTVPESALLRSHKEPSLRVLTQTRDMLEKFGVILNIESAGTLQESLSQYESEVSNESTENFAAKCRMIVINSLCAKSMTRAIYRCSNSIKEEDSLRHYALNVPLYTHFTSPIRRYSDCIVHRLLYASIRNVDLHPKWNSYLCTKLATNCNVKKYSAKVAQEQSNELFFTYLLDLRGPLNTQAVVMDVKNRSIDVIIIEVGLKARVYFADMEEEVTAEYAEERSVPTIKLSWKGSELKQIINVFSIVDVRIQKHPALFRLHGVLLPPSPNIMSEIF
ncbi:DIS3-like exonuclease 2 isoform X2 [Belonocnema kinseyi]|uniref:DIS3-like exonuclease 2 isoform X2 n=1 Tax=Belonocnema kinseyi TaxID=2817044 RepID=UPI00143D8FBC|nr:DIS3-like exonuclease 2 isoform X2 [Belonocnema kinseyi]